MVYVVAQLTIDPTGLDDRERHQRYTADFMAVLKQYGGEGPISINESPEVMEGSWERDKVVLLSFADRSAYEARASSEAYQRIARDRIAATEGPVLRVRGIG